MRWYLTTETAEYSPPTLRGGWDSVIYPWDAQRKLSTVKTGGSGGQENRADLGNTAGLKVCFYRGVTDPLPDLTIGAGALLTVCAPVGGTPSTVGRWRIHAYLTVGDSDTVRQTILDQYMETGSRLWPSPAAGCATEAAIELPEITVVSGDRLVVTFGAIRASDTFSWIGFTYGAKDSGGTPLEDASPGSATTTAGWIEIVESGPSNEAPVVEAGPDQTVTLLTTATATLAGAATDDGLPNPPAALTYLWTVVSSPSGSTVTFTDDTDPTTDVEFDTVGEYVLRLTADDSELTGYDDVTITVVAPTPARFTQVGADVASVSTPDARFAQVGADLAWQLPILARFTQVGMDVAYVMPLTPPVTGAPGLFLGDPVIGTGGVVLWVD